MTEALTTLLPNLGLRLQFAQPRPMRGTLRSIRGVLLRASVAGVGIGELCVLRKQIGRAHV